MTLASVIVQDLTYTEKTLGSLVTISYTNGGTAGAEAVSVSGKAITVQIASTSTAAQIKTAVEAEYDAHRLVTITVTGTGSNVQKTCKSATLAGGVAAAKASLTLAGTLKLTAKSTGTTGNDTTIIFTSGATAGEEVVDVTTAAISVQIAEGVSTYAQVKTALEADVDAAALVDITFVSSSQNVARVSHAGTALALSGGLTATAASVTVQDLKFAWNITGTAGNGKTMTYTTGATAGSEVGTVVGDAYNVQIENAVSTATQVKTEVESIAAMVPVAASGTITYGAPSNGDTVVVNGTTLTKAASAGAAAFSTIGELETLIEALSGINSSEDGSIVTVTAATTGSAGNAITLSKTGSALVVSGATLTGGHDGLVVTIPGTAGTAQKTVNVAPVAAGVGNGANSYYVDNAATALTASFVRFNFSCHAGYMKLICDETSGAKGVIYSLDGVNTHGTLLFGQSVEIQDAHVSGIWMKYVSAAPAYRLMVVGR